MNFYPYTHKNLVLRDNDLAVLTNEQGRLCGYCTFTPDEIPKEWHGEYNADALQYLAVHGGITYCEVHGGDEDGRRAAFRAAYDSIPRDESASLEDRCAAMGHRQAAAKAAALAVPYTHIVFGFDCGHYGDEEHAELSDPQHVLGLARQMRQQIGDYAKIIPVWRSSLRETRIEMLEAIRTRGSTGVEIGFGGLIGLLSGATSFGPESSEQPS